MIENVQILRITLAIALAKAVAKNAQSGPPLGKNGSAITAASAGQAM